MKQVKENYTDKDIRKVAQKIDIYAFRNFTICGKVAGSGEIFFTKTALADVIAYCQNMPDKWRSPWMKKCMPKRQKMKRSIQW